MRPLTGAPRGMKRVFLQVAPLLEGTWLALPASLRGFWLQLQAYASAQENGGRIAGAKSWRSPQWLMTLGAGGKPATITALVSEGLARWDGDDLVIVGYDLDAQAGYQRRRESGRQGGQVSAQRRAQREAEGGAVPGPVLSKPSSGPDGNAEGSAVENGAAEASTAGTGAGESGPVPWGMAAGSPDPSLSGVPTSYEEGASAVDSMPFKIPENSDQAIGLFVRRYEHQFGVVYEPDAADTMGMRAHWGELEAAELSERISSYLKQDPAGASVTGFLGWTLGAGWDQPVRGKSRS